MVKQTNYKQAQEQNFLTFISSLILYGVSERSGIISTYKNLKWEIIANASSDAKKCSTTLWECFFEVYRRVIVLEGNVSEVIPNENNQFHLIRYLTVRSSSCKSRVEKRNVSALLLASKLCRFNYWNTNSKFDMTAFSTNWKFLWK